jgi:hypothetical protein
MESRGNGPTYPEQYGNMSFRVFSVLPLIKTTLQRSQLRSRLIELGSADLPECRLQDIRLVDIAAVHLCRRVPHLFP